MDVAALRECPYETGVAREVRDHAQLDLVVVRHEKQVARRRGRRPCATACPSSVRTGMLWRFGWSEESRPVRATVWLKDAWIRPSAATSASRVSP